MTVLVLGAVGDLKDDGEALDEMRNAPWGNTSNTRRIFGCVDIDCDPKIELRELQSMDTTTTRAKTAVRYRKTAV